jgi:hypothetical protein
MSNKQILAQKRNYLKFRLMGMIISPGDAVTEEEAQQFRQMYEIRQNLLQNWDAGSERIFEHSLPRYKCHYCGKRTNREYKLTDYTGAEIHCCKRHYKAFLDNDNNV